MKPEHRAYSVHLLTATGAVLAMLALISAVNYNWPMMFVWLVAAFAVDGIDGPLARRYDVQSNAPQVDGALLDLIVDYLTYVFIPAFALYASGLMPGWTGWAALVGITFTSALYFAYTGMKTTDHSFSGFPGCWNMVVLVIFALKPPVWLCLIVIVALAAAMFTSLRFIHPVRTQRWRAISLPMILIWTICGAWAAWVSFDPQSWARVGLIISSLYLVSAGVLQQILPQRSAKASTS
ncbi:CDP-alcohol phosphatidyltransferase family protein [Tropicimonas sp. TH_r6]|uniref:CDP-alcohol phosphatidyltransferase family protein n=1 Tax=Tropicimonas sp. TH_r6 TaxID=3082085 RepID=UPI002954AA72|nr:CDP-alcohol phosphatidyltransferase family protein [Tropicimonas sp. TH_r6]MDV7142875.1 CDP-alcohol phosphatidyltransferase family protein [Tropicimonas sp. TH_r6]